MVLEDAADRPEDLVDEACFVRFSRRSVSRRR